MKQGLQSVGAVAAGYLATAVLIGVTVPLMGAVAPASLVVENTGWVVANLAYGCVYAALGGAVAARLAPGRPLAHAVALGTLMAAFALMMAVGAAPTAPGQAAPPAWYYPVLAVTAAPSAAAGGWLYARRRAQRPGAALGPR